MQEDIIIGIDYQNIPAYEKKSSVTSNDNFIECKNGNSIYSGFKWECVEFVRRWYIYNNEVTFDKIDRAVDLISLQYLTSIYDKTQIFFHFKRNYKVLYIGDILVFDVTEKLPYGHVAIVTRLDGKYVYISEQNMDNQWENSHYSRKFSYDELFHHKDLLGFKTMYL